MHQALRAEVFFRRMNTPVPESVHDIDWERYRFAEDAVLCIIRDGSRILLIHKKTGLGKGKINAPGGRIMPGELPRDAAAREVREEVGLTPGELTQVAELNFIFTNGYSLRGFVFFARSFTGTQVSTPEADPFWCAEDQIPYDSMWEDDRCWLPRVLAGEKILGRFIFDEDRMMSREITLLP
jgi:8-oxo-dGTP diphosphatase